MPTFEFDNQFVPQNLINIPDTGNFCLEAIDEKNGFYHYLMIKASLGTASIVSFGPVVPDVKLLPDSYSAYFVRMPFKEEKIKKFISSWLNDKNKHINTASIVDEKILLNEYRDLKEYIESYSEEIY